jgi:CBS-domain-containing membrane protein
MDRIDQQFRTHARQYLAQAALATGTLAIVLIIEDALTNVALITAIAASAFLVFIGPNVRLAAPRRLMGGHFVGCCVGLAGALVLSLVRADVSNAILARNLIAAMAVGVGIVVMGATDTEHPPAAGTVLGLVLGADAIENALLVMLAIGLINAARALLRRWLADLL